MKLIRVFFVLMCLMTVPAFGYATQPEASVPLLRVGLWQNQRNIALTADCDFVILDNKQSKLGEYKAGEKVFLSFDSGRLTAGGREIKALEFTVKPLTADGAIAVNNKFYRGWLLIKWNTAEGLQVVNLLNLEQYLYSIVPSEMPSAWHMEALKAQAVAARSYAMARMNSHRSDGYDVCTGTHCQVYNGKSAETDRARQAVDGTTGLIMLYRGQAVMAAFHSSSGGRTENAVDVWGRDVPYLRSVPDYDADTPNYKWEKRLNPVSLAQRLSGSGYDIGNLQALELSKLNYGGTNESADRTPFGHLKEIRFIGDKGSITLDGDRVRDILGLKSTLFDVELEVPNIKNIDVEVGSMRRKQIDVNLPAYKETKGWLTDKASIRRLTGRSGETVVITGYGFGHGLGMSQWGAKQMAEKVSETNTTYFAEILRHYYTGVQIGKIY